MNDYITKATRTESVELFKVDSPRLLHAAVGISTEVTELLLAEQDVTNVKEEMGDILWYVAIAASELRINFTDFLLLADQEVLNSDPLKALLWGAAESLDVVKRSLFYGLGLDEAKFGLAVGTVLRAVEMLAADEGWTLAELQETNIAKLTKRYPEKFTRGAAVDRDLEAEREAVGV